MGLADSVGGYIEVEEEMGWAEYYLDSLEGALVDSCVTLQKVSLYYISSF